MRKISKVASKVKPVKQKQKNVLDEYGTTLFKGMLAGFLFQGAFIALQFENRIVRGVTANRLCKYFNNKE